MIMAVLLAGEAALDRLKDPLARQPISQLPASGFMPRSLLLSSAGAFFALSIAFGTPAETAAMRLHYAANGNFSSDGTYLPGKAGFDLADVGSVEELDSLPAGVKGLVWVGQCNGVDAAFLATVRAYAGHPKLFGFYLMDDPDPTGRFSSRRCAAEKLAAEADWVHANMPGVRTFIVLMNLGSSKAPSFAGSYNPVSSHVDLFGVSSYPCRTELNHCDFDMIDRSVAAARAAGIPRDRMVPVYQAFGGGGWPDDEGGRYVLPTVEQERQILARWKALVPRAVFDYAYSWGSQRGDTALQRAFGLQTVFASHNRAD
jgi:hypothetical protein